MTVTPTIAISSSKEGELALAHASSNASDSTRNIGHRMARAGEWERSRSILLILYVLHSGVEMGGMDGSAFFELVAARRGHFKLESGHHSSLWLELDSLFSDPQRIMPFVDNLVSSLRSYHVDAVCGPLLGGAFVADLVSQALGVEWWFTERVMPSKADGMYQTRYCLPAGVSRPARGTHVAIVDDVMSAGSALRGTYEEMQTYGATPVVAGALLVLGSTGADWFAERGVPVEAAARESCELWLPADCPLCADGVRLEEVADSTKMP